MTQFLKSTCFALFCLSFCFSNYAKNVVIESQGATLQEAADGLINICQALIDSKITNTGFSYKDNEPPIVTADLFKITFNKGPFSVNLQFIDSDESLIDFFKVAKFIFDTLALSRHLKNFTQEFTLYNQSERCIGCINISDKKIIFVISNMPTFTPQQPSLQSTLSPPAWQL